MRAGSGVALAATILAGCTDAPPAPRDPAQPVKLLIVGLDGASWQFLDPLLERDGAPNLARLIRDGVRAPLDTIAPSLSPAVWTTIATGFTPAVHGIDDFNVTPEGSDEARVASSDARRTEALWTILSRAGLRSGFVGWWVTWPAERVSGYQVSEQFLLPSHDGLERATFPTELAARLDAIAPDEWPWLREVVETGRLKLLPDTSDRSALSPEQRLEHAHFYYGQDYRAERMALHLLANEPRPDLFAVTLRKIDTASHYLSDFLPEEERDAEGYSRLLALVYAYDDALLGQLIAAAGPAENVLVISDHGFERVEDGWDHKHAAPPGILIASGPAFGRGIELPRASVLDVAPTVLHLLGLPVGRDMEGRVLSAALAESRPVSWVSTHETGRRAAGGARSPLEEDIRERLRALGYVQ